MNRNTKAAIKRYGEQMNTKTIPASALRVGMRVVLPGDNAPTREVADIRYTRYSGKEWLRWEWKKGAVEPLRDRVDCGYSAVWAEHADQHEVMIAAVDEAVQS